MTGSLNLEESKAKKAKKNLPLKPLNSRLA